MTGKLEQLNGQTPQEIMAILKDPGAEFEITAASDENNQIIRCRIKEAGKDSVQYIDTQMFPGRMLKEVLVTTPMKPTARGTEVTHGGKHLRTEASPGTMINDEPEVSHEIKMVWTYLKNIVMQQLNANKVETVTRTY